MHPTRVPRAVFLLVGFWLAACAVGQAAQLVFARSVVVAPAGLSPVEQHAARMLVEEVEKRTGIRWPVQSSWPTSPAPVVALGPASLVSATAGLFAKELADGEEAKPAEGFRLVVKSRENQSAVLLLGNDSRGVLFGVGRLLRELRLAPGRIAVADDLDLVTSLKTRLRGHQLGYRPKTHSYDAWDVAV